jgi:SagB-type dehydrogenase family enzyme
LYLRTFEEEFPVEPREELFLTYHLNSDVVNEDYVYSRGPFAEPGLKERLMEKRHDDVVSWSSEVEPSLTFKFCNVIKLPKRAIQPKKSFEQLVRHRRSLRDSVKSTMTIEQLAYVLENSVGITYRGTLSNLQGEKRSLSFRAVPSGGGLYPIECYIIPMSVIDLEPDLYHYNPYDNVLEKLDKKFSFECISKMFMDNENVMQSSVFFIMTAMFRRSALKYGERSYRFVLIESGAISEHIMLAAEALNFRGLMIGGFIDPLVNKFIGCNGIDETVITCASIGLGGENEYKSNCE